MGKQYQWRTNSEIISGGYTGEEIGVDPPDTGWRTTDVTSGSTSASYYFRDSDSGDNANSSRVDVHITESWTASINTANYLTVTLTTVIDSIIRSDIRGTPGTVGRSFFIRRDASGPILWQAINDPIDYEHTILSTPITLDNYTFTLAPGENLSRGSVYFRGNTQGHDSDVPPSIYIDLMWMGTEFRNILPKDYRPGATLRSTEKYGVATDGLWYTHNRANGACHVLSNTDPITWHECRTINGDSGGQGNPPLILHAPDANSWYNQQLLGKE